jgi:hypothetical protein
MRDPTGEIIINGTVTETKGFFLHQLLKTFV